MQARRLQHVDEADRALEGDGVERDQRLFAGRGLDVLEDLLLVVDEKLSFFVRRCVIAAMGPPVGVCGRSVHLPYSKRGANAARSRVCDAVAAGRRQRRRFHGDQAQVSGDYRGRATVVRTRRSFVVSTANLRCGNEPSFRLMRVLWSQSLPSTSDRFKELLLELAQERSLDDLLPLVTRRLAEHEDVALARLWLLDEGDLCAACANAPACADETPCLHLVASAARDRRQRERDQRRGSTATSSASPWARSRSAPSRRRARRWSSPMPRTIAKIRRPDWVRAQGIAAFAGLPLSRAASCWACWACSCARADHTRGASTCCASSPTTPRRRSRPRARSRRSRRCATSC